MSTIAHGSITATKVHGQQPGRALRGAPLLCQAKERTRPACDCETALLDYCLRPQRWGLSESLPQANRPPALPGSKVALERIIQLLHLEIVLQPLKQPLALSAAVFKMPFAVRYKLFSRSTLACLWPFNRQPCASSPKPSRS
jgi:hypothetical protein